MHSWTLFLLSSCFRCCPERERQHSSGGKAETKLLHTILLDAHMKPDNTEQITCHGRQNNDRLCR